MKIRQWLGYNEDASQYLLRPGELRTLMNLQARRPGMLLTRRGLTKIYGKYDNETIYGIYRRSTILGTPNDFLWLQKVLVERQLTAEQIRAQVYGYEYVWMVRRIEGYQSRIIDTLPITPTGALAPISNMCIAEDRHNRLYLFYGHGIRPRLYRPDNIANVAISLGLDAPLTAPSVQPTGTGFFIEGVDVSFGGGSYYDPPTLTLTGGSPERPAKLKAIVQSGNVVGVDIVDGGSNYRSPPTISASIDKVGTGFRARGNISTAARTISGFDETKPGAPTGTAPSQTETYGATNGTTGNSILYLQQSSAVTKRLTNLNGAVLTFNSVDGIQVGDVVTMYPSAAPFNNSTVTVTAINAVNNTVTISSGAFVPTPNTIYDGTFRRPAQIGQAPAEYDSARRRFYATIPLSSASSTGSGAHATLEFSPKAIGFGLNAANNSSVSVVNSNWQTYRNGAKQLVPFLYDEFWGGSDFDLKNSSENALYGGLQAGRTNFVRGFSGSVDGRGADVFWPDYSTISVWFCTGTYSNKLNEWTRADVTVETEIDPNTNIPAKVLRFRLRPTREARTVRSLGGSAISTEYQDRDTLPDAVPPEVKLYLRECPESWIVAGDQCLPKQTKEAQANRLPWWSQASGVPRPIVDIRPAGGTLDKDTVVITDAGSGWQANTLFAFRIYQANAYEQRVDYNTAVRQSKRMAKQAQEDFSNRFVEFKLTANTPDNLTPHGPPNVLISPAQVTIPGEGYQTNQNGTITLYKRDINSPVSAATVGQTITWTATTLSTMTAASAGHIASLTILNKGRNYFAPPTVEVRGGGNGYGLSVLPVVENGRIESVQILDPGVSYTESPELFTSARAAQLTAVMRPAMRGKYRCAYRFVDRSDTIIGTATASRGNSTTTLTISGFSGIEPDMVIEHPQLPFNSRVKSVSGDQVEINQEITGLSNTGAAVWSAIPNIATTPRGQTQSATMQPGARLNPGEGIFSPSGRYQLQMQTDGNLVLIHMQTTPLPTALWATMTLTPGSYMQFDTAGRFRIVSPTGATLYTSQNSETANGVLEVLDTGTVAIFAAAPTITVTIRDMTRPIAYSDLSPIKEVDAGPNDDRTHASKLLWSLDDIRPPERADIVELWRTSADQSLVFYRLEAYGKPTSEGVEIVGTDTLTDEELFDADRPHYAAMPIVLPNGNVNAYRFGIARSDMQVAVAFQDRLWVGVSTSGKDANTLFYSEFDEFESFPDVNELPIQNNQKSTDVLTALVPFGSMLLAMQHSHTYAVAYNADPAVDATIQMMAHRGCLHQRAWDIHENVLYAADESGIYSMARSGEVKDISLPIRDFFVSELLDFSKRETFFLQTDPRTHILRFFCTLKTNPTATPAFALCYDIQAQTWWTESYPNSITAACTGRPDSARLTTMLMGAVDGNLYEIDSDSDHANDSLTDTFVTIGGRGYREAPRITVPNCSGAIVQGVVSEGRLVDVIIQNAGWAASYGIGLLAENGNELQCPDGRLLQGVEYDAIKLDIAPPDEGGTQAVAYANFSVTPLVRRICTIAEGDDYVRLTPARVAAFEPEYTLPISTESSLILTTEAGAEIRLDPPPVEIGMEAVGDFIPLQAYVSRIDRSNVHLSHPDGTPALMLFGDDRTNEPNTPTDWLENGGTSAMVKFYKPYRTHIPFRMATGFMQLVNEDNAKGGDALLDRSVTLVYTPTQTDKEVELIERFNGRDEMRANLMRRDRGGPGGFAHRQDSASTVLNTSRNASRLGFATGVAKAKFASQVYTDMTGEDQHLQVELYGRPEQASPWQRTNFWNPNTSVRIPYQFVLHSMTVNGVIEDAE